MADMLRRMMAVIWVAALSACVPGTGESKGTMTARPVGAPVPAAQIGTDYPATRIIDAEKAARLRGANGITLQWISWDWRGQVEVRQPADTIFIDAGQNSADAPAGVADLGRGSVSMTGYVEEVGADYFIFNGTITIADTPDHGRACVRQGQMTFSITQGRRYWRLQDMQSCGDGLTDYVDIYL